MHSGCIHHPLPAMHRAIKTGLEKLGHYDDLTQVNSFPWPGQLGNYREGLASAKHIGPMQGFF